MKTSVEIDKMVDITIESKFRFIGPAGKYKKIVFTGW